MISVPKGRSIQVALALSGALAVIGAGSAYAVSTAGPASTRPETTTPHLPATGATVQVRQLVQCGSTMYAVGNFTTIIKGSTTYTRHRAFSFQATSPYTVSTWNPNVNGTVDTIAFNGGNCANAYLGGQFTAIGSTTVKNLAEVSTSTGKVITSFGSKASGHVYTIASSHGHLLVGGAFSGANGSTANPRFMSLNPTTGKDDGYLSLHISGTYTFTDQSGQRSATTPTKVYNQQISANGTRDLVEGVFTTIGGQPRRQVAILDLGTTRATTDAWYATELNANCSTSEPFYAKGGAWSPDGSTVYLATTGYKPASGPGFGTSQPRAGLCDAAAAFPSTAGTVTHKWINYTGCDSLYTAAADPNTAYFGGHERW